MPKASSESTPRAHPYAVPTEAKPNSPALTERNLKAFQAQLLARSGSAPSSGSKSSAVMPTPAPKVKKATAAKVKVKAKPKVKEEKGTPKGGYDRALLVSEVSKVSFPEC